jgi:hypothetical protein
VQVETAIGSPLLPTARIGSQGKSSLIRRISQYEFSSPSTFSPISATTPDRLGSFLIASKVCLADEVVARTSRSGSASTRRESAAPTTGKASTSTTPME